MRKDEAEVVFIDVVVTGPGDNADQSPRVAVVQVSGDFFVDSVFACTTCFRQTTVFAVSFVL